MRELLAFVGIPPERQVLAVGTHVNARVRSGRRGRRPSGRRTIPWTPGGA